MGMSEQPKNKKSFDAGFRITDIPQRCATIDHETGERTKEHHSFHALESVELRTPFTLKPAGLNFFYPENGVSLMVCLNCGLVVGYA